MAAASSDIAQELERVVECPVCLSVFDKPRTLPCLHIICNKCVDELVTRATDENRRHILCPLCKQQTPIPTPPNEFPISFMTNSIVDLLAKKRSSGSSKCHPCLEEGTDSIATSVMKKQQYNCNQHEKEFEYVCQQCDELLCVTCKLTGEKHFEHKIIYAKDQQVAESHKDRLRDFNAESQTAITKYGSCMELIEKNKITTLKEFDESIEKIENRFEIFTKVLKAHRDDLIQQRREGRKAYEAMVDEETTKLNQEMDQLTRMQQKSRASEKDGSYMDIVHCSVQEVKPLKTLLYSPPTNKVKVTMLEDQFGGDVEEIKTLFGTITTRVQEPTAVKFTVYWDPTRLSQTQHGNPVVVHSDTNKVKVFDREGKLVTKMGKDSPLKKAWNVTCHDGYIYASCKSSGHVYAYDESYKYCRTIEVGATGYPGFTIWQDKMFVTSYNEHVVYSVPMKLEEAHTKEVFAQHDDMQYPWYVGTNGHNVAVSCYGSLGWGTNNILVFDLAGRLLFKHGGRPKGSMDTQLYHPYEVVVNNDGSIIIADCENKRLVVLNAEGHVSKTIPLEGKPKSLVLDNQIQGHIIATLCNPYTNKVVSVKYT
jgi:hypothetical protein